MAQTNILLEAGTNEVEIIELYLDEVEEDGVHRRSFGINVAKVKRIIRQSDMKNFSGRGQHRPKRAENAECRGGCLVLGMFEFMGKVIPLIDLSTWLDMNIEDSPNKKVVVTEFNNVVSAFLISGVNRIHRMGWDALEPLDANMARYAGDFIIGTVKLTDPDRIMQVLDLERAIGDLNPELAMETDTSIEEVVEKRYFALNADDSTSMRKLVANSLQRGGFNVSTFSNGDEAWTYLKQLKLKAVEEDQPITRYLQLVVSDIEMPKMDGHSLTRRIKEDPVLKRLPVYLFSSLITKDLLHKGESVGASRQYSKPQIGQLVLDARRDAERTAAEG